METGTFGEPPRLENVREKLTALEDDVHAPAPAATQAARGRLYFFTFTCTSR